MNSSGRGTASRLTELSHKRIADDSALDLQYRFIRELGEGTFGHVVEYERIRDGEHFAIKILQKDRVGHTNLKLFEREVSVMKAIAHPHIVQLAEILENGNHLFLVLELCELGSLSRVLKDTGPFPEPLARDVMRQLGEAISYMHRMGVVHRDIKLQNVLATRRDPRTGCFESSQLFVKLADFSLAILKKPDENLQCVCGTLSYMSPEVLEDKIYGQASDNWSMGVILYQLLSGGDPPFPARDGDDLRTLVQAPIALAGALWRGVSAQALSCIRSLLTVDPVHRMTASELLTHPWLTGHDGPLHNPNVLELMHAFHAEQQKQQLRVSSGVSSERGRDSGRASGASSSPASTSAETPAAPLPPERRTPRAPANANGSSSSVSRLRPPLAGRASRSASKLNAALSRSSNSLSVAAASGSRASSRNSRKPAAASATLSERAASGYPRASSNVRPPAGGARKQPKSSTPTSLRD